MISDVGKEGALPQEPSAVQCKRAERVSVSFLLSEQQNVIESIKEGFVYVWSRMVLRVLFLLIVATNFLVLGPIVVVLMTFLFQIPWWAGLVAVPLAVVMGFVAARVTGETDVTPTKALGPVTQLLYGGMLPRAARISPSSSLIMPITE